MPMLTILASEARAVTVECEAGEKLDEVLRKTAHAPMMPCAGQGRCGKCLVWVKGQFSDVQPSEEKWLETLDIADDGFVPRLVCQCRTAGDGAVRVPVKTELEVAAYRQAACQSGGFYTQGLDQTREVYCGRLSFCVGVRGKQDLCYTLCPKALQ